MSINDIAPLPEDFRAGAGDEKLLVIFHVEPLQDEYRSDAEGRPIFVDTEFVRIHIPGDKTSIIDRPASKEDKARFAVQYARFKQGAKDEAQTTGTPLREWPVVTRSQVEELKFFQIVTVEHLADVSDAVKLKMPGLTKLSQQAKIWLEKAKAASVVTQASAKIDEQANRIASLERTVGLLIKEKEALAEKAGVAA